jgi:hypothetical protein
MGEMFGMHLPPPPLSYFTEPTLLPHTRGCVYFPRLVVRVRVLSMRLPQYVMFHLCVCVQDFLAASVRIGVASGVAPEVEVDCDLTTRALHTVFQAPVGRTWNPCALLSGPQPKCWRAFVCINCSVSDALAECRAAQSPCLQRRRLRVLSGVVSQWGWCQGPYHHRAAEGSKAEWEVGSGL